MADRGRSFFINKHDHALTMICGTYIEGCKFNPIIFQISDRETEIWVERVHHRLRDDAEGFEKLGEEGWTADDFIYSLLV